MADKTAAGIFGDIFEYLAKNPTGSIENKEFAKVLLGMANNYRFGFCEMDCDDALVALGLAQVGIDPDYPDDDECVMYNPI
jgi:hypothetical protein